MQSTEISLQKQIAFIEDIADAYDYATLPCPTDERILSFISQTINSTPEHRGEIYQSLTDDTSGPLQLFGQRMSTLSIRKNDPHILLCGLVALTMATDADDRSMAIRLSLFYHSAQKLGLDPDAFFEQATEYLGPTRGHLTSFLTRKPRLKEIEAMGFREAEGPSGFIYATGFLCNTPPGFLFENEPSIPNHLEALFSSIDIGYGIVSRFASYLDIRKNIEAPKQIEAELLQLLKDGSHDTRVTLALGGLGCTEAVDLLNNYLALDIGDFLGSFKIDAAVAMWWISQPAQALEFIINAAHNPILGTQDRIVVALRYFNCKPAAQALRMMLTQEMNFTQKNYALESLLILCDPAGAVDKRTLNGKMRSNKDEFFAELDCLIEQQAFPNCY